jgi:Carboxypeptidase regulatory-like domain/TonB dependent receptor
MKFNWYNSGFSCVDRESLSESLSIRRNSVRLSQVAFLLFAILFSIRSLSGQSPNGTISGFVTDSSGAAIVGAEVLAENYATGALFRATTNGEGLYLISGVSPGAYRLQVSKVGFKTLLKPDITLNVQDALAINFILPIGAVSETVTITAGAPLVDTQDATVSTTINRQFAENLPMNGRSFQSLIYLAPGVVATPTNASDNGQFSVNGQRASSNYWMVDGVSANIGISPLIGGGNGLGGTVGSVSALGGTNSLVSIDAMQEFRIQTSTYAPEFGRTPGGQVSIVTRSGTNQFHGTAFDYFRNDVLDANNWFNGYTNNPPLPKAKERQNDFGGTFGGPISKSNTFFFFSYEGLRLRLPETELTTVPDLTARQNAVSAMQTYLNAFPRPNGADDLATGTAEFNTTFSNPASLDAYSLRIDRKLGSNATIFGRYNYSPSELEARGGGGAGYALSVIQNNRITTQTATIGATWAISPALTTDLRFNYSRTNAEGSLDLDSFGGAVPLASLPFPPSFSLENSQFDLGIYSLENGFALATGSLDQNIQRQINIVDSFLWQKGKHSLKAGFDYRHLAPLSSPYIYSQGPAFLDVPSSETGISFEASVYSLKDVGLHFNNVGIYAQDTWHLVPRLTLTYGLRWDIDFAPSSSPGIPAVTGYSLTNFSNLALAPLGTPPYRTTYGNFAPRIGIAYEVSQSPRWQTVLRGGFGVFYDLLSSETGNTIGNLSFLPPFGNSAFFTDVPFPLTAAQSAPVPIPATASLDSPALFNPGLKLPYILEWNIALQQAIGADQTISATYVGASGRRLLQTTVLFPPQPTYPDPNFQGGYFIDNTAQSNYNALQIQFQRRLSHGLQTLASYTWSHSIDDGSAGSIAIISNAGVPGKSSEDRGNSDFDIRNAFTAGVTYDVPFPHRNPVVGAILGGWSLDSLILARSAPPVNITDIKFYQLDGGIYASVRPDLVPGQPTYLHGSEYPGGKALNPSAFTDPPIDPTTGNPLRQGDLARNFIRGFGATQWDFAVHRDFSIHESVKLQFRAEMFNLLNHPNFGPPNGQLGSSGFGLSTETLNQSLSGAGSSQLNGGAFNPLYQIGGPRSVQLALKLIF